MKTVQARLLFLLLLLGVPLAGYSQREMVPLPEIDHRFQAFPQPGPLDPQRQAAIDALKARIEGCQVRIDPLLQTPKFVYRLSRRGFLTEPDPAAATVPSPAPPPLPGAPPVKPVPPDPDRPIRRFLADNAALYGHGPEAIATAPIKRDYITDHNKMRTVVWEQQLDGIPVLGGVLIGHINRAGALVSLSSQALPNLEAASGMDPVARAARISRPPVSTQQAVAIAAGSIGEDVKTDAVAAAGERGEGPDQRQLFRADGLSGPADARLVWLPMHRTALRLCWEIILVSRSRGEGFSVLIDTATGETLVRHSLTSHATAASYRVFTSDSPTPFSPGYDLPTSAQPDPPCASPDPLAGPPHHCRTLEVRHTTSTVASPNGWINDEDNITIGNNVDAHLDLNNANPRYGDPASRPIGSPPRVFDSPLDLSQDPSTSANRNAAVANAFYWCNWMHDRLYDLGFTEAAGNFQFDNFGRGGHGSDAVQVDVQDSIVPNNADFFTPPDREPTDPPGPLPRLQLAAPNPALRRNVPECDLDSGWCGWPFR